jgi:hypothetical protein
VSDGPVRRHMRELRGRVPGGPLRRRRILGEARAHLEDAADREQQTGRTREEAERLAVERFGMPFAERRARRTMRVAVPAAAAVITAAGLLLVMYGRGAGNRPQAHGPVIPYSSVPLCGTQTWKQMRAGVMVCRPQPAVGTIGVPAWPVWLAGVTPGSHRGPAP